MLYRADIDGIRALAVLSVILYHLKLDLIPGGFVGVDIFFVISGYLITGIIAEEIRGKKFSIVNFYERRCRRIFPALIVVVVLATLAGYILLLPGTLREFGQSLAALGLFSTNILFFSEHGYFDGPSELKPLLHTWSLSVEEQFYIIFPVLLFLLYRYLNRSVLLVLTLMLAFSLWLCLVYSQANSSLSFYMPYTRAWELLAGSIIAVLKFNIRKPLIINIIGVSGFILLFASFAFISAENIFPGWVTTIPVLATVMVILAGSKNETWNISRKVLSFSPLVHIGKLSYSLYLIHWPLIVFSEYYFLRRLNFKELVFFLVTCFLLAQISYSVIENPIRRRKIFSRGSIFSLTILFLGGCVLLGTIIHVTDGLPKRFGNSIANLTTIEKNPWRGNCLSLSAEDIKLDRYCVRGNKTNVKYALIGDSHADALVPAVIANIDLDTTGIAIFTQKGCRPFFQYSNVLISRVKSITSSSSVKVDIPTKHKSPCGEFMENAYEKISKLGITNVIVHARWALQYYGNQFSKPSVCYSDRQLPFCSEDNNAKVFEKYMKLTLDQLQDKRVLLVGPVPEQIIEVPDVLGRAALFGRAIPKDPDYTGRGRSVSALISSLVVDMNNLYFVDTYDSLCKDTNCLVVKEGKPVYNDTSHLSVTGSQELTDLLRDYFIDI